MVVLEASGARQTRDMAAWNGEGTLFQAAFLLEVATLGTREMDIIERIRRNEVGLMIIFLCAIGLAALVFLVAALNYLFRKEL